MNIYESIKENLLEAEDDDEFEETEVKMEVPEEGTEPEEMTDKEVEEEKQEDAEDIVEDEVEEPFYATDERFDELREILEPLEFRLLLINDKYLVVGRLNGADIEILKQNAKATEDEDTFETFGFVEAPDRLEELLTFGTVYEDPDLVEEGEEALEPNHEEIVNFLKSLLPKEAKDDVEEKEEESEETEEIEVEPEEEEEDDE
jgi:hypothetical protein